MAGHRRRNSLNAGSKRRPDDPPISYRDRFDRLHIGWTSANLPATEIEQVTGWSYAPGHAPNHKEGR